MALAGGQQVGPYEVVAELGAGGMGVVYRARDVRLGRLVALKTLPAELKADQGRLKRFELEAKATSALNHPNIVALYDVGEHDGTPYVVTELLEGSTLREALDAGPLPQRKAIDYAAQLAHGLAAAHDKGIVHRDLKPENLFITRDGHLKILDFGLAKATEAQGFDETLHQTAEGAVLGTAGYMAPEQVRGRAADARSDVFALGAVLYEMLSGRRAFEGATAVERGYAILNTEPAELNTSPALDRVTRRCLEKAAEQRFQSARDVAFALEAVSGVSSSTEGVPLPSPPRRSAAWAALVVAALVGVPGYWLGKRAADHPAPTWSRVTPRTGTISAARFSPDGRSVYFSGEFSGEPSRVFVTTPGSLDARPISDSWTKLLAVSASGEMAIRLERRPDHATGDPNEELFVKTLARVPLTGGAPRPVLDNVFDGDLSGDGTLATVQRINGTSRLEYPPGKLLFETRGFIFGVRVSPRGDKVAFRHHPLPGYDSRNSVEVLTSTGAHVLSSSGWDFGDGLAWSPDGSEVWFPGTKIAAADGVRLPLEPWSAVHALSMNGSERTVAGQLPGWVGGIDVGPDERVLLLINDNRWGMEMLRSGSSTPIDLSWLDGSAVAGVSNDGKTVLFAEAMSGQMPDYFAWLRSTDGSPAIRLAPGVPRALSPDGKWALVSPVNPFRTLEVVPTGPGELRTLAGAEFDEIMGSWWSVDGKSVVVEAQKPGERARCWSVPLDGGAPTAITEEGVLARSPPSPDGQLVVWSDGGLLVPLDGGSGRPVMGLRSSDLGVQWAPDGALYVVERHRLGHVERQIVKLNLVTGARTPWRAIPRADHAQENVVITPDGNVILYNINLTRSQLWFVTGLR